MNRVVILGWITFLSGSAIWLYGYCITGHPSIINWHARIPMAASPTLCQTLNSNSECYSAWSEWCQCIGPLRKASPDHRWQSPAHSEDGPITPHGGVRAALALQQTVDNSACSRKTAAPNGRYRFTLTEVWILRHEYHLPSERRRGVVEVLHAQVGAIIR